jgi:glycosyltransferase involved in cell wall biosynthesis
LPLATHVLAWARVRVLIDYRPALRQRTGVGEYAHQLAAALVPRLGSQGAVVLFSSSWKDRLAPSLVPGAVAVDRRVPVRLLNHAWHRWEWPPVEMMAGAIDVAHAMHPLLIPVRNAAQVVTIHDLYFMDHPESAEAEIRRDYPALAPSHARRADAIVVVSEYTAGQVRARFDVGPEQIAICPPGAPSWPSRAVPPGGGPILFVGSLEPRKNLGTLLTSYARLIERMPHPPELVLAGREGASATSLLERIARPPLAGRVRHLGYVPDEQRQQLYREASVLVLPSLNEGFGMPALEAMTVGVPVVAANRGALPEVVGEAGLLVDSEDVDGFSAALERILTDRSLAQRCSELGVQRSKQFTWEASADRLLQAYRGAITRRAARTR